MKKFIIYKGNKYETSKITFVAYKKLFPNKTEKDFKVETGRDAEKVVKKEIKKDKKEIPKK